MGPCHQHRVLSHSHNFEGDFNGNSDEVAKRVVSYKISGVSSKEVTGMVLLQAYFRNSDVLNGFYGIPRSGENYI